MKEDAVSCCSMWLQVSRVHACAFAGIEKKQRTQMNPRQAHMYVAVLNTAGVSQVDKGTRLQVCAVTFNDTR